MGAYSSAPSHYFGVSQMSTRKYALAQKLYSQGVSLRDIAATLQCSVLHVSLWLSRGNV